MRIYISGAITGRPTDEYKAEFGEAERQLWDAGQEVINPARLDYICPDTFDHEDYMDICMILIRKCDAIYMLPSWRHGSRGAQRELDYALTHEYTLLGDIDGIKEIHPRFKPGDRVIITDNYAGRFNKGTEAIVAESKCKALIGDKNILIRPDDGSITDWYDEDTLELRGENK